MISIQNICDWAGSNPSQRKFVEGERVFQAGHVIKCGKMQSENAGDSITFTAVCLQTTNLKEKPHEINGEISTNGNILHCHCSCKAGLGEKCKHIIAALLYMYKKGKDLESLSCTDVKCKWKQAQNKALQNYNAAPLMQHSCFAEPVKKQKIINANMLANCHEEVEKETDEKTLTHRPMSEEIPVSKSHLEEIQSLICDRLPNSAISKHLNGRHNPVIFTEQSKMSADDRDIVETIFEDQDCELMTLIKEYYVPIRHICCSKTLVQLSENLVDLCERTKNYYAHWLQERQCRITGSICYGLYTYTKKNRSDSKWEKKCDNTFTHKDFKTDSMMYGSLTECEAREAFRIKINVEVLESGLIVSKLNPWLAYSPDGVIIKNKNRVALLEIKCPVVGKNKNIVETVNSQIGKCLIQEGENIKMKERHAYYGQIQLGMAVLNLNKTYFVIYSSFDKELFILVVARNDRFVTAMLKSLKKVYYSFRLHRICIKNGNCDKYMNDNANIVEDCM